MAEVARREARRRKILENSEGRLKKITGVENKKSSFDLEGYRPTPVEAINTLDSSVGLSNNRININSYSNDSLGHHNTSSHSLSNTNSIPGDVGSLLQSDSRSLTSSSRARLAPNNKTKTAKNDIHKVFYLVCMAVMLSFFTVCFPEQLPFVNYIFVPFLCYEITSFVVLKGFPDVSMNGVMSLVVLANRNIDPNTLVKIMKSFQVIGLVLEDMMVYFLAYVCSYYLFKFVLI